MALAWFATPGAEKAVERVFGGGREGGKSTMAGDLAEAVAVAKAKSRSKALVDASIAVKHQAARLREAQRKEWTGERARAIRMLNSLAKRIAGMP